MRKFLPLILLISIYPFSSYAQPNLEWAAKYAGDTFNHFAKDMAIDNEGNVYVTGTLVVDSVNNDFITLKYDKFGTLAWARTYDGPQSGEDEPAAIKVDNFGNVVVAGTSRDTTGPPVKTYSAVIKYSPKGDTLWTRRYINQDSLYHLVSDMVIDSSSNIYLYGQIHRATQSSNLLLTKYSPGGDILWQNEFDALGGTDLPRDIKFDRNNNIAIYASTALGGVMIKYSISGDSIWGKYFSPQAIMDILFDSYNNTFLGGVLVSPKTNADFYLAKIDTLGNFLWQRTYHNNSLNNVDAERDIFLDIENNIYITGVSGKTGEQGWDYLTIKYNSDGDSLWVKRFNPVTTSNDEPVSVVVDRNENVFVTGKSDRFTLWDKISTVVYNSSGSQLFTLNYDTAFPFRSHRPIKALCDTSGHLYVGGNSQNAIGKWDMVVLKYSPVISSISQISNEIPASLELFQNYPNPFNSSTIIRYNIPNKGNVKIRIIDMLGREVETLTNKIHEPGQYQVNFNGERYTSGIYFYSLFTEENPAIIKKLIIVK